MIDQFLQRAHLLMEQKRYKEAEKELVNVLSMQPSNEEAHSLMAILKNQLDDFLAAMNHINSAIASNPANSYLYYIKATIFLNQNKAYDAEKSVKEAIQLNPSVAEYFGLLSVIELYHKNWQSALDYANQGLAIESDNLQCLNSRSTALLKLDKKEESYQTIQEALYFDPSNAITHTNLGWGLLEKGNQKEALEHFKKALQIDPMNSYAKSGMVEALKARFWIYRLFLKYSFWISNMKGNMQTIIVVGFFIGVRVLRSIADSNPSISPFIMPIVFLYTAFALSTWLIRPISDLFLRLNAYGKYALTKTEIQSSNFVGVSLAVALIGGSVYLFTDSFLWLALCIFGFTMMIPFSSMLNPHSAKGVLTLKIYTGALALVGVLCITAIGLNLAIFEILGTVYLIGVFAYQWVANAFILRY